MNKAERNELKKRVAEDTRYTTFGMENGNFDVAMIGIDTAKKHLQQLIDDEKNRAERREAENDTMRDDEKSEVQ